MFSLQQSTHWKEDKIWTPRVSWETWIQYLTKMDSYDLVTVTYLLETELDIEKCPITLNATEKDCKTIPWTSAQKLCSSGNRTGLSIRTTTLLRHRAVKNTPINKIPMFSVSLFWHLEHTTNHGPTSCIPLPHRRDKNSFSRHSTGPFCTILNWRQTKRNRQALWCYFYMPRYARSPFGNMSRLEYRHLPQCISTVRLPKMPTYLVVQR